MCIRDSVRPHLFLVYPHCLLFTSILSLMLNPRFFICQVACIVSRLCVRNRSSIFFVIVHDSLPHLWVNPAIVWRIFNNCVSFFVLCLRALLIVSHTFSYKPIKVPLYIIITDILHTKADGSFTCLVIYYYFDLYWLYSWKAIVFVFLLIPWYHSFIFSINVNYGKQHCLITSSMCQEIKLYKLKHTQLRLSIVT